MGSETLSSSAKAAPLRVPISRDRGGNTDEFIGGRLEKADLGRLYEKYGYLLYRRCLAILQSRADAADALQNVFLRAQRYGYPENSPFTLQRLYVMAANCCFDLRQRNAREGLRARARAMDSQELGTPRDSDRRALVGAILRRFDSKTREIGVLHHLDGLTQEEVAERTGYSRKTVAKKLKAFEQSFQKLWLEGHGEVSYE